MWSYPHFLYYWCALKLYLPAFEAFWPLLTLIRPYQLLSFSTSFHYPLPNFTNFYTTFTYSFHLLPNFTTFCLFLPNFMLFLLSFSKILATADICQSFTTFRQHFTNVPPMLMLLMLLTKIIADKISQDIL